MSNIHRSGIFRYSALPAELQKNVLEKYFEDNTYAIEHLFRPSWEYKGSRIVSRHNIINVLLVNHNFKDESMAAIRKYGRGTMIINEGRAGLESMYQASTRWRALSAAQTAFDGGITIVSISRHPMSLMPILENFPNIQRLNMTDWSLGYEEQGALLQFLESHWTVDVATGKLQITMAECIPEQLRKEFSKTKMTVEEVLKYSSIQWQLEFQLNHWCRCGTTNCFLRRRRLRIQMLHSAHGCSLTEISIKSNRGYWDTLYTYGGTDSEVVDLFKWRQAKREGDETRCQALRKLWKARCCCEQNPSICPAHNDMDAHW